MSTSSSPREDINAMLHKNVSSFRAARCLGHCLACLWDELEESSEDVWLELQDWASAASLLLDACSWIAQPQYSGVSALI